MPLLRVVAHHVEQSPLIVHVQLRDRPQNSGQHSYQRCYHEQHCFHKVRISDLFIHVCVCLLFRVNSTSIIVSTVTSFMYVQGAPAPARRKLALEHDSQECPAPVPRAAPTIPSQLKSFASAAISSGCLCLSIPTKTNTATQGVPATVKAQATATTLAESTVTVAQTDYVTQYTTVCVVAEGSACVVQ
jgi:hypothetical protein